MMFDDENTIPFFSVVVPCYNRAELVVISIKSILDQDYRDFEVLVVDDGSTDETAEKVKALVNDDNRVKYFYKENEERSIARNFGIKLARGKYVTFLDSDDRLHTSHLKTAYALLERNDMPEVGHLGFQIVDKCGNVILKRDNFDSTFKQKLIHENILLTNAIFIRSDIAKEVHFIPSKFAILSEDWYLWLRLASRFNFCFDNSVTSSLVHHDQRSLVNIDPLKLIHSTNVVVDWLKRDSEFMRFYMGRTNYHFANHFTFLTLMLAVSDYKRDAMKFMWVAIRYDFSVIFRRRFLASLKHLLLSFIPRR